MLAKRLQIAELLLKGNKYDYIRDQLKVGFSTIGRIATWLSLSGEGFKIAISRKKQPVSKSSLSEKYDPSSLRNIKRRYSQYYWPQLLIEKILTVSDENHRQKITSILQSMNVKNNLASEPNKM